jgi:hypothetical protein
MSHYPKNVFHNRAILSDLRHYRVRRRVHQRQAAWGEERRPNPRRPGSGAGQLPSRSVGGGLVDLDEVRATWTTKVKAAARARLLAVPGQRRR